MASSGYLGTSNQYVKYWIEVIQNSQNIGGNTSNVTVKVWATRTNSGYTTWGTGSVTLKVNGTYYNSGNKSISITSSSVMLHSWTGNIGHNSDGTKSLTCSAAVNIPSVLSSSEQSYTVGLTTIPRTSSFTLNKTSCELGSSFTVNISRASSSFTHAVTFHIGGETRYMQNWNGGATSVSYTPPVTDAVYMPRSTSMGVTIQVSTYSGSTLIGYTTKTLTLTCPSSVVPSFSNLSIERIDNYVPASWNMYLQSKSRAKLTINGASGVYGSSITQYSISGGGYSGNSTVLTTGILNTAGTNTFTATITDSRGRTATKTVNITVEPYSPPRITATKYYRSSGNATEVADGTGLWIQVDATYTSLGGKNPLNIHVASIRDLAANRVLVDEFLTSGVGKFMAPGKLNPDTQYKIELIVSDGVTHLSTQWLNIGTAFVPMDFKKGGKGVAIGKVAEEDILDVNMPSKFRQSVTISGPLSLSDGNSIRGFANVVHLNSKRDFTNGTLIKTSLRDANSIGYYLEIKGNMYGGGNPCYLLAQGYLYNNTVINHSASMLSQSRAISEIKVFGLNGVLCFWFPRNAYWQGFECKCTAITSQGATMNKVTSIEDAAMPTGVTRLVTTKVSHGIITESGSGWNAIKYPDGTMIYNAKVAANYSFTNSYGAVYYSKTKLSHTFSVAFVATPTITVQGYSSAGQGEWCAVDGASSTGVTGYCYNVVSTTIWVEWHIHAIGRWY